MGQDWIIGVLTDLRTFARANGLPLLSRQLEETTAVALREIAANKRISGGGETQLSLVEGDAGKGH